MKKLTAIFLSLIMVAAICVSSAILSFAESETTDTNLALNKPLVGINPIDGDDTRKGNLTDGKIPETSKRWFVGSGEDGAENYMIIVKGKNANEDGVAEGVIDLGSNCEVTEVKVYIGTGITGYEIYAPEVTVSLSSNGTNYTEFGKYTCADTTKDFWDFVTISGAKATARYAKVKFTLSGVNDVNGVKGGTMALLSEVQVYGTVSAPEGNTSSTDSSAATSSEATSSEATSSEATSSEATSSAATSSEANSSVATSSEAAPSAAASSADTSSTTPATPSTGDVGVVVVVILAVVAAFGSAVVVKARR